MSILAIVGPTEEGTRPLTMASPIFVLSDEAERQGGRLRFEVLGPDSYTLVRYMGETKLLILDDGAPFWGKLETLEPCKSTHPGLAFFRDQPTVLATMTVRDAGQGEA